MKKRLVSIASIASIAITIVVFTALFGLIAPVQARCIPFTIYGQVFDTDGTTPIDGVNVTVINLETGSSEEPTVTASGGYYADNLGHLKPNCSNKEGDRILILADDGAGKINITIVLRAATSPQLVDLILQAAPSPTVAVSTDKFVYNPGDTMTIIIDIANPTKGSVTFQWYWGVPQYSIWVPVTSAHIPAGYEDTHDFRFTISDWSSTPFGNVFYVQLLDESEEVLDADIACWAYSPGGEAMPLVEVDVAKEIKKTVEGIEFAT